MNRAIREWFDWRGWTVAGAAIVIVLGVMAILSSEFRDVIASQVTAAWVQAIVTVLGIGAAWWATFWQHKKSVEQSRMDRYAARREKLEPIAGLVSHAHWLLCEVNDVIEGRIPANDIFSTAALSDDFVFTIQAFDAVPIHDLPAHQLVVWLMDTKRSLGIALKRLRHAQEVWTKNADNDDWRKWLAPLSELKLELRKSKDGFDTAVAKLGRGEEPTIDV